MVGGVQEAAQPAHPPPTQQEVAHEAQRQVLAQREEEVCRCRRTAISRFPPRYSHLIICIAATDPRLCGEWHAFSLVEA